MITCLSVVNLVSLLCYIVYGMHCWTVHMWQRAVFVKHDNTTELHERVFMNQRVNCEVNE